MHKGTAIAAAIGMVVAMGAAAASAQVGIPAKAKAKKVQGDLVQAYEGGESALLFPAAPRSSKCSFLSGKFKNQIGKDTAIQLKGVVCDGVPYTGQLCAHTKGLNTIANVNIDKAGNTTPVTCVSAGNDIDGTTNFSTSNIGTISCDGGKCKGAIPPVLADPCPNVDKISELARVEVFDGPDLALVEILGSLIASCCGPGQTAVGPIEAEPFAPCDTSGQRVMAEMGTYTQIK